MTTTVQVAEAALIGAKTKLSGLATGAQTAKAALAAAVAHRATLVTNTAAGNAPSPVEHKAADAAIQAAQSRVALLEDAEGEAMAMVAVAEGSLHAARQADWEGRMAAAIETRCCTAGKLDQAIQAARAALELYHAAGAAVNGLGSEGRAYVTNRFHVRSGGVVLPRATAFSLELELSQPDGIGGRKPVRFSVEQLERTTWGVAATMERAA